MVFFIIFEFLQLCKFVKKIIKILRITVPCCCKTNKDGVDGIVHLLQKNEWVFGEWFWILFFVKHVKCQPSLENCHSFENCNSLIRCGRNMIMTAVKRIYGRCICVRAILENLWIISEPNECNKLITAFWELHIHNRWKLLKWRRNANETLRFALRLYIFCTFNTQNPLLTFYKSIKGGEILQTLSIVSATSGFRSVVQQRGALSSYLLSFCMTWSPAFLNLVFCKHYEPLLDKYCIRLGFQLGIHDVFTKLVGSYNTKNNINWSIIFFLFNCCILSIWKYKQKIIKICLIILVLLGC